MFVLSALVVTLTSGILWALEVDWSRYRPEDYDFGGATVHIRGGWIPYRVDTESGINMEDPRDRAYIELVQEKFNVVLEFSNKSGLRSADEMAAGILAGEWPYDIIGTDSEWASIFLRNGFIKPIGDALNAFMNTEVWNHGLHPLYQNYRYLEYIDGETYMFFPFNAGHSDSLLTWNISLFERDNLPNLYNLVEAGEWTWETFTDIARRAKRDTTGDGVIDQWGYGSRAAVPWAPHSWIVANNGRALRVEDGRMMFALDEPEAIEALTFLQEIYNEGLTPPGNARTLALQGKVAMLEGWIIHVDQFNREHPDDFGVVPLPRGPRASEHVTNGFNLLGLAIPTTSQHDPEALIALTHAIYRVAETYGVDPIRQWDDIMHLPDRKTYDYLYNSFEIFKHTPYFKENYLPGYTEAMRNIIIRDQSPAGEIASLKLASQTRLDELFGQ